MPKCRDCKLFDLGAVRSKSGAILSNRVVKCGWVSREVWPVSVQPHLNARPTAGYVQANDGARCPRFIKREREA